MVDTLSLANTDILLDKIQGIIWMLCWIFIKNNLGEMRSIKSFDYGNVI